MSAVFGRHRRLFAILACALAVSAAPAAADTVKVNVDSARLLKLPAKRRHHRHRQSADRRRHAAERRHSGHHRQGLRRDQPAGARPRRQACSCARTCRCVGPRPDRLIVVYKGIKRETWSCAHECQPRNTLGDDQAYFAGSLGQTTARNGAASSGAPPPHRRARRRRAEATPDKVSARLTRPPPFRPPAGKNSQTMVLLRDGVCRTVSPSRLAAMIRTIRNRLMVPARRLLPVRSARRFARAEEAAAAVEFALVAAPFLALIFAIMETALVFFAGQTLEATATEAGRMIMTGQAQTAGYTSAADFKTNVVCPALGQQQPVQLRQCPGRREDLYQLTRRSTARRRSRTASSTPRKCAIRPAPPAPSWWCGSITNGRSTCRCSTTACPISPTASGSWSRPRFSATSRSAPRRQRNTCP